MDKCNHSNKKHFNNSVKKSICQNSIIRANVLSETSKYFLVNVNTKTISQVSLSLFCLKDLPTILVKGNVCKFVGERRKATKLCQQAFATGHFKSQGIFSNLRQFGNVDPTSVESITTVINNIGVALQRMKKIDSVKVALIMGKISLLLLELNSDTRSEFNKLDCLRFLYDVVVVCYDIKQEAAKYNAQGIESLMFTAIMHLVPAKIGKLLKAVSDYSSVKVCDDLNVMNKFVGVVLNAIEQICVDVFPEKLVSVISPVFKFCEHYKLVVKAEDVIKLASDSKFFLKPENVEKVDDLWADIESNGVIQDWMRTSGSLKVLVTKIERIRKIIEQYKHASRQEPFCFAFEGEPGVRKSVLMTQLVATMKKTTYTHIIKAAMDGKDFYDSYNNEEIFVMDDVGQSGPSQFRPFFNLIAPVKMPLDCAAANLKDTKFFTSESILFTTNRFMALENICRSDMIDNVKALWRRVTVFKVYDNLVQAHYFNTTSDRWESGFAKDVHLYMERNNISIPTSMARDDEARVLGWLYAIYEVFRSTKSEHFNSNINRISTQLVEDYRDTFLQPSFIDAVEQSNSSYVAALAEYYLCGVSEMLGKTLGLVTSLCSEFMESNYIYVVGAILAFLTGTVVVKNYSRFVTNRVMSCNGSLLIRQNAVSNASSSALSVQRAMKYIKVITERGEVTMVALISGHVILTASHIMRGCKYGHMTVYKTTPQDDFRMLDNIPIRVLWQDDMYDVCLLAYDSHFITPFKNISHLLDLKSKSKGTFLIHPEGIVALDGRIRKPGLFETWSYDVIGREHPYKHDRTDSIWYSGLQEAGMCGSIVYSEECGFMGIHVAGGEIENEGAAIIMSGKRKELIVSLLNDMLNVSKYDVGDKLVKSGIKLEANFHCSNPKKNTIVKSELYGLLPNMKEPVDPIINGPHTVKDSFKEALDHVEYVPDKLAREAVSWVYFDFQKFDGQPLSDKEVIKGTNVLAGMTNDTATGVFLENDRNLYIDFERGELTPLGHEELSKLRKKILSHTLDYEDIVAKEAIKIETRAFSKNKFPRTFRVLNMFVNYELKRLLGGFISKNINNKWQHGIMLSFNPYYEFHKIALGCQGRNLIASDVKFWDKKMVAQIQILIADFLMDMSGLDEKSDDYLILHTLLASLCNTPVAVNDDVYVTTHSLPSGCYITTLFNSLVQKAYLAIWYKQQRPDDQFYDYKNNVNTYIMGDDILLAVHDKVKQQCNALTLKESYTKLGLDLTDSMKKDVTEPFDHLDTLTFLKRRIVFNYRLGRYVGVLDESSLYSSLSWVDSTKDIEQVMRDKIGVFKERASYTRIMKKKFGNCLQLSPKNINIYSSITTIY